MKKLYFFNNNLTGVKVKLLSYLKQKVEWSSSIMLKVGLWQLLHSSIECKFISLWDLILTLVMQSRATRNVPKAVAKVKSFLFLLRILKSSVRPVMTASMPPIWWTQTERGMRLYPLKRLWLKVSSGFRQGSFAQTLIGAFQLVLYADSGSAREDPFRASTWQRCL